MRTRTHSKVMCATMRDCLGASPTLSELELAQKYWEALEGYRPQLELHMSVIVEEILRQVKPISVYLTGSFARNEGPLYVSSGLVHPLRDYDILVIVERHIEGSTIGGIRRRIHKRLGLPDPFSASFKFAGFVVWITQATFDEINGLSMLKFYELRMASRLLWGNDVRDQVCLRLEQLSRYNGLLVIFGKVEGLLGLLDVASLRRNNGTKSVDLVYECLKTYTEMGTSLGLLAGIYRRSFVERCTEVCGNFGLLFPELAHTNSALPSRILSSAYRRGLIDEDFLSRLDVASFLNETIRDLGLVVSYYLHTAFRSDSVSPQALRDLTDDDIDKLGRKVVEDLFAHLIRMKLRVNSRVLTKFAVEAHMRWALLRFFVRARRSGHRIMPRLLFWRGGNIIMRVWLDGFRLLRSIKEDGTIDERLLYTARTSISKTVKLASAIEYDPEISFLHLQRLMTNLLGVADTVFHRKG